MDRALSLVLFLWYVSERESYRNCCRATLVTEYYGNFILEKAGWIFLTSGLVRYSTGLSSFMFVSA